MGEYFTSNPTGGTTTTLVDATLTQWMPAPLGQGTEKFLPWVYGTNTADVLNRAVERRAQTWDGTNTLTFFTGAPWPAAISTGAYEVHLRWPASRKLEALNEACGQLGLSWYREFVDTSITTASQTWSYALP